jgi:acyl carrier protein
VTVRERIAKVLEEVVGANVTEADLAAVARLDEIVPFDSLTAVQLVAGLEQEFGVRFAPDQLSVQFLGDARGLEDFLS